MALPSGTGSGAYNAGDETDRASRLFPRDPGVPYVPWGVSFSPTFAVVDAPVIIRGYDLPPNSIACVEMVTGCRDGDLFNAFRMGGRCWCICCENNTLYLPFEGRYRIRLVNADPMDVTITVVRTSINFDIGRLFEMSCDCPAPFNPVEAAVALAGDANAMDILSSALNAIDVANVLAASPPAVQTLCTALTPCILQEVQDNLPIHVPATITADQVITVTASGADNQTFALDFNPLEAANEMVNDPTTLLVLRDAIRACLPTDHVPASMSSSDGSLTINSYGTDNQTFDITLNYGALPVAALPALTAGADSGQHYGSGPGEVRPDGFLQWGTRLIPFVNP
jgi:hypothetical protein